MVCQALIHNVMVKQIPHGIFASFQCRCLCASCSTAEDTEEIAGTMETVLVLHIPKGNSTTGSLSTHNNLKGKTEGKREGSENIKKRHTCMNQLQLEFHLHSGNTQTCRRLNRFHTNRTTDQDQSTNPTIIIDKNNTCRSNI